MTVDDKKLKDDIKKARDELAKSNGSMINIVEDIPTTGLAAASGAPVGERGAPGLAVKETLRDILGWTWKPADTTGFRAALDASFTPAEEAGVQKWKYTPTGTVIRADLGAVSGAQAVLLQQVKGAADRIVPQLENIHPLAIAPDPQQVSAIRSLVIGNIRDLAEAFAKVDGPTIQLVDELWRSLLGSPVSGDPERPSSNGHLGQMRRVFQFSRRRVNTVEQELILSQWIGIVSELTALEKNYKNQRGYLAGTRQPQFLGTGFVAVSQALEVMADSVREFRAALLGHFIEDVEQNRIKLKLQDGSRITLGALLAWAEHFPTEALATLKEAGREGVRALIPQLDKLRLAAQAARPDKAEGVPYLYRKSPVIVSTENALELSILNTLDLLLDLRSPGRERGWGWDPWYEPNLGETPLDSWKAIHTAGDKVVYRFSGDLPQEPVQVGILSAPDYERGAKRLPDAPVDASKPSGAGIDEREASLSIAGVEPGRYYVVAIIGGEPHVVDTLEIEK